MGRACKYAPSVDDTSPVLVIGMAIVGKMCAAGAYAVVYNYSAELLTQI